MNNNPKAAFSLAEKAGLAALLTALLFCIWTPFLAAVPLAVFLLLCLGAPFFPGFSFFLPIISRSKNETTGIAITFDDGPSPVSTPILLDLLAKHGLPATFFVVGKQAAAHPELIADILDHGHTIGNHSLRHDNFLMLRTRKTLEKDIRATQEILQQAGIQTRVFRPPAGATNPYLATVLAQENLTAVTYSCRAFDRGNKNISNLAGKILDRLRPGDIIMLHDLPPNQEELSGYWQQELELLFAALQNNFNVVPLEEIIERPVMNDNRPNSMDIRR